MARPSLNSTRNFKLPPIQGAVTTSSLNETSWIPRPARPSQIKSTRIARDTFISPTKPNIQQPQIRTAPKRTYSEVANSNTSGRLDLDLGRNLPRPYAVLPPIRSETEQQHTNLHIQGKSARLGRDFGKRSSLKSQAKVQSNHNNLREKKTQHDDKQSGNETLSFKTGDANDSIYEGEFTKEENNNLKERKLSATFLLFMKGARKGRRCGVCLENERTLINVCELLKEIFLRRNMEEMYLI